METADDYRQAAAAADAAADASFERCDTDGFLSQWAHGITAQKYRLQAQIEDAGGLWFFPTLQDGDRKVDAKLIDGKFGRCWMLADAEYARYGRKFVGFGATRILRKLGLHEGEEPAPAIAVIRGKGRGLSGQAWACVVRKEH